ncbi:MAG: ribonuclease H-like domain-containing protein [Bacillota bacterium]
MKRNLGSRLSTMQKTGEIKTARQVAETHENNQFKSLFPCEDREEKTPFGRCYLRELYFPLDHLHGRSNLFAVLNCRGPGLALPSRDSSFNDFDPRKAIFLDIETTGLAGGTGTWAFLIGLGKIEKDFFVLHQYFLRKPKEEKAILSHFNKTVSGYSTLITFNGKLFDLPLLQTRQLLAGINLCEPDQHLDLLQCARALWKKRLPSRSLSSLEEALLGLQRKDDLPGAEIPGVYFEYLRKGKTGRLKKVFEHNVLDILSMVTLLEKIYQTAGGFKLEHPAEALALGTLCLEEGKNDRGIGYLREAADCNIKALSEEASLELSLYFKKEGRWEEAAAIWQEAVNSNQSNPRAYVELAKYYEHRCREYHTALKLTEKALAITRLNREIKFIKNKELRPEALQHRLNRLKRRLCS